MTRKIQQFFKLSPLNKETIRIIIHHKVLKRTYKFLQDSQWWNKEEIEEFQLEQLNKLLNHAFENVPFYTKMFNNLGLKPKDIQDFKDLKTLPYTTKQDIKEKINEFKAKNYPKHTFDLIKTGGSSGKPIGVYIEKGVSEARYMAYNQNLLKIGDCHFKNKQCHLLGNDDIFKYQAFGRVLILSSFFATEENLPMYIEKLRKFKPRYIIGFASAITNLAKFMSKNNIEPFPSVNMVVCGGETVYEWQRELIEKTFRSRFYGLYAHTEQVIFANTCDHSYHYHVYPQYGITELIDNDDKPITNKGEMGEMVGTGFTNYIFPLIRYKSEDMGIFTNEKCKCGRKFLLLENILGRIQQFIVTKSKILLPLTGIYGLVAHCTQNVVECQFYQDREGEITLRIIKDKNYSNEDEKLIKNSFKKKFRDEINLMIEYIEKFPRTPRGKHQFLIQKLPVDSYNIT